MPPLFTLLAQGQERLDVQVFFLAFGQALVALLLSQVFAQSRYGRAQTVLRLQ
jgi:hypothetical protein